MRIYLAARYSRRLELCEYRAQLVSAGHTVDAVWLNGEHQIGDHGIPIGEHGEALVEGDDGSTSERAAALRQRFAQEDFRDVLMCDLLIAFTEQPTLHPHTAGNRPPSDEVEEWKGPVGRLLYMVSSFGRVRNADGEILAGSPNRGYWRVKADGKFGKAFAIHQLVSELFLGKIPEGMEIDHVDGNKANNWRGNLEYVTHLENIQRAERHGARGDRSGENNPRSKLTWDDVCEIRRRAADGETKASLSREFSVSDTVINSVVKGKSWRIGDRGGRNVELGIALGMMKRVLVCGPRENLFCWLDDVRQFDDWPACFSFLTPAGKQCGVCSEDGAYGPCKLPRGHTGFHSSLITNWKQP